jgi:hypothetical protein
MDGKVIIDKKVVVGATHFPTALENRLNTAKWIMENSNLFDVIMGDFNTFPQNGGPEMIEILKSKLISRLPPETSTPFRAFAYDTIMVPNEKMDLLPDAIVLKKGEKETEVAPNSWLDHPGEAWMTCGRSPHHGGKVAMISKRSSDHIFAVSSFTNKCSGENCSGDGSDHNLMIVKILFSSVSQ